MNIKPTDKTIRELLGSKRQFIIPRFQRAYSWDKKNYQEFLEDMINNLTIIDGKISSDQYFLGTMLFIGNFTEGTDHEIQVVDGQQRLTTITILFSVISEIFSQINEPTLSEQLFSYIMTSDDDGNKVRVLKTKTSYPFFSFFIQDRDKKYIQNASTDEEINIEETYNFFKSQLCETKLKSLLIRRFDQDSVNRLGFIDILKAVRDQVLNSTFISISTTAYDQANKIFEILNAKGKRLAHIDLIKNKIFEKLIATEPADFAEEKWNELNQILSNKKDKHLGIGLATFYQHYWSSKYKKIYSSKLYDSFLKMSPDNYKELIDDLIYNAKIYIKIFNPNRADYDNRKEYFGIVQSMDYIHNKFNTTQSCVALLALFDAKENKIIDLNMLKRIIYFIENFHFAYSALTSNRANKLEKIYSSFAISLRKAQSKSSANGIINKLITDLTKLFPKFDVFRDKFIQLSFSKKDDYNNIKAKYAINKINCIYTNTEIFSENGSIEHIIPEGDDIQAINIGNLILLEQNLNTEAGNLNYADKINIYSKSQYRWIKEFLSQYPTWNRDNIECRANELAKLYYNNILGLP